VPRETLYSQIDSVAKQACDEARATLVETRGVALANPLSHRFDAEIAPYLVAGARSGSILAREGAAANYFRGLRESVPAALHPAVNLLEDFCVQRRQFDVQRRLHLWLHTWLWIHLPLSAALVVLMFVHIFVALKYW